MFRRKWVKFILGNCEKHTNVVCNFVIVIEISLLQYIKIRITMSNILIKISINEILNNLHLLNSIN